jgi:hypothetical protein
MMVYNTQNYWVYGLYPSSYILKNRKNIFSQTASVTVLRWGGRDTCSVGSLRYWSWLFLRDNRISVSPLHLRTETEPVSETMCVLVSRISDNEQIPKIQWFWVKRVSGKPAVPWGFVTLRVPHYLDNRLKDGGKVISVTRRPPFTPRKIPGTHFY